MKFSFVKWMMGVAAFVLMIACDDAVVFEENIAVEKGKWSESDSKKFEFEITDTISLHNLFINIRNGEEYPFSNLYMFVQIEFPNGKSAADTLECYLADPSGNWIGSGLGDIYDSRFIYQQKKAFPIAGKYSVTITQAMRNPELEGIYDVGFRVEKNS